MRGVVDGKTPEFVSVSLEPKTKTLNHEGHEGSRRLRAFGGVGFQTDLLPAIWLLESGHGYSFEVRWIGNGCGVGLPSYGASCLRTERRSGCERGGA